jgi:hypothetical protein
MMGRAKLLGLALVAVFAASIAMTAVASAANLPENLPTSTERTWKGEAEEKTELETVSGSKVTCTGAGAEGNEEAGKPLGSFHITFSGCASLGQSCTGLGDTTAGTILVLGTWHLVFDKKTPELLTAVLFLIEHVHFSCSALVLVEVLGSVLCLELKVTEKSTTHLFHCIQSKGVQEDKSYFNEAGTEVAAGLKCSINHAAEQECGQLGLAKVTYGVEIFADI